MANDVASLSFVTADSIPVAINAIDSLGANEMFALKLEFARGGDGRFVKAPRGDYSISLDQFALMKFSDVFVVDHCVADTVALDQYRFTITDLPASYAEDRFALIVKTPAPLPPVLSIPETICHNDNLQIAVTSQGLYGSFSLHVGGADFRIDTTSVTIPANLVDDGARIFLYGENICGRTLIDTIRINVLPAIPKPVILETISCTPGPASIEVAAKGQSRFIWFNNDSLRSELSVSESSFITPSIDSAAVLYVASLDQFNCRSDAERVEVSVVFPDSLKISLSSNMLMSNIGEVDWYNETFLETAASISPDSPGRYRAVSERQGCRQEAYYRYEPPPAVEISPVPFANFITIKAEPGVQFKQVTMINTNGSEVFHSGIETFPLIIDTSQISPGIYFVQLSDGWERRSFGIVK
jgi:hypothetical protein